VIHHYFQHSVIIIFVIYGKLREHNLDDLITPSHQSENCLPHRLHHVRINRKSYMVTGSDVLGTKTIKTVKEKIKVFASYNYNENSAENSNETRLPVKYYG